MWGQVQPEKLRLWSDEAPHATGSEEKDIPTIDLYLPETEAGNEAPLPAVVVCPGGGYGHLAMDHEGKQIAQWLNENQVAAIVLNYRHRGKGYGHPVPLLDVQRAIRTVRANAANWKIDSNKIGVMGFSAGGHLASTAATHFDDGQSDTEDPVDQVSCRPDFAILCYGVLTMGTDITHKGSQNNLLGSDASDELIQSMSNEKQVTANTPPTFLFHTDEDKAVLPENSVEFYLALRKNKVPAEMHIFEKGRHGVGLGKAISGTGQWSDLCILWMQGRKLINDN